MLSKKIMDQRFAEKMRALKEGRTPVFVAEPTLPRDPVKAADARIRDKISRHFTKAAPVAVKNLEESSKPKGEEETESEALEKEISVLNKADIVERIKVDFGIEVDKDSLNKAALVALYLEESSKPKG